MGLANIFKKMLISRTFSIERGRIRMFGTTDWTLYPAKAMAKMIQRIGESEGKEILYKIGYEGGKDTAEEISHAIGFKPGSYITQKTLIELLEFLGYGRPQFIKLKVEKDGHHHILVHVKDNPVIEKACELFGHKSVVCYWFMGIYAAHGEVEFGAKNVKVVENKCICKGAPYCEWESKW
jgi:predicted hydrocarbon binding protein